MGRLRCELSGLIGTLTLPAFWRSLVDGGPLVVFDGHVIAAEPRWMPPEPSPDPRAWDGWVERSIDDCVRCGLRRRDRWRRFWMVA